VIDYDMQYIKELGGGQNKTRMTGAVEAIQAIVTDSGLTSHVDFGFGVWSESGASFTGWSGHITNGTAVPCHNKNCLKVRVHRQGAGKIESVAPTIVANGWATYSKSFANLASQYYLHSTLSPIDPNLDCQNSHVIVIGDGDFTDNITAAKNIISNLNLAHDIKTHAIAYGGGISASGLSDFEEFAVAGGTDDVIIANTTASLKTQLKAAISQVIAAKLSFTAPAITATIEKGGSLFQAQFDYEQNKEWKGTLTRTAINSSGVIDEKDKSNWSAADKLPAPDKRKIWSEIPGTSYKTGLNNFTATNWNEINTLFQQTNNEVSGYHSVSDNPVNSRRCASASGVANGTDDDIKGLINFIRGKDYFDYDGDCNLTETRPNPLGDIYHSEMVVVAAPSAETAFVGSNPVARL